MHPSPALDDHHLPDHPEPVPTIQPIPGYLVAAVAISTVTVLLVLADITAPEVAVPAAVRELAVGLMVAAWALWYISRVAAQLRAAIHVRLHGVCCAEAYVAGLARKPFPGSMGGLGPDGRHLHSA